MRIPTQKFDLEFLVHQKVIERRRQERSKLRTSRSLVSADKAIFFLPSRSFVISTSYENYFNFKSTAVRDDVIWGFEVRLSPFKRYLDKPRIKSLKNPPKFKINELEFLGVLDLLSQGSQNLTHFVLEFGNSLCVSLIAILAICAQTNAKNVRHSAQQIAKIERNFLKNYTHLSSSAEFFRLFVDIGFVLGVWGVKVRIPKTKFKPKIEAKSSIEITKMRSSLFGPRNWQSCTKINAGVSCGILSFWRFFSVYEKKLFWRSAKLQAVRR